MKKLICLIFAIVFSLCMTISVFALEEDIIIPEESVLQYSYISKITSTLTISSKNAICQSSVIGNYGSVTKIILTQTLQKKLMVVGAM